MVLYGRFSDISGRKAVCLSALALLSIASVPMYSLPDIASATFYSPYKFPQPIIFISRKSLKLLPFKARFLVRDADGT